MADEMHVVTLPWLAFGHMIPFLHLSISLAKAGIRVSYFTTARNIQRLPKIPQHLTHLITLVELPLATIDGLPEGAEATVDILEGSDEYLKKAFDLSFPTFQQFISDNHPDWIIHDLFPCWASRIAREFDVPHIVFSIFSGAVTVFFGPIEAMFRDKTSVDLATHEDGGYHALLRPDASGLSAVERVFLALEGSAAMAVRSCTELEEEFLNSMQKLHQRPIIPIGLLPPTELEKKERDDPRWDNTFKWLDQQPPKSVVFVSFGSECKLSKDQVQEIAHGLELSRLPFLWALRMPVWATNDSSNILPPGFETQTAGRGMIYMGWAPQPEILAHPSIGGSLFHAGWSSIIETLQHGHVAVVLPFVNGQTVDARHLVDKGLAIQIQVNRDGSFHRDVIAGLLRRAMVEDEGERLRIRSMETKDVFADQKLHQDYMNRFIDFLKSK